MFAPELQQQQQQQRKIPSEKDRVKKKQKQIIIKFSSALVAEIDTHRWMVSYRLYIYLWHSWCSVQFKIHSINSEFCCDKWVGNMMMINYKILDVNIKSGYCLSDKVLRELFSRWRSNWVVNLIQSVNSLNVANLRLRKYVAEKIALIATGD